MAEKKIPLNFSVQVYGNLEPYSPTISKARVRIFYRGLNRNWSYISDEFAEKLINSLPYSPVKAIYDETEDDFTDHGNGAKGISKAYGVVPERNNGSWERHIDSDGVERTYYCCDVLLWTALYENAKKIPGKAQSMELYEPSIKGTWRVLEDGWEAFEFTEGCFLGLQVLGSINGEKVEPCFEGSSFYSLSNNLSEQFSEIIKAVKNYNLKEDKQMDDKVLDNSAELEKEANEPTTVVEEPVPATDPAPASTEDATAPTGDATAPTGDMTAPTGDTTAPTRDTTAPTGDTTAPVGDTTAPTGDVSVPTPAAEPAPAPAPAPVENYQAKYEEAMTKISELEAKFAEAEQKISELSSEKSVLQDNFNHLKAERDNLAEFKTTKENAEKEEILSKYSVLLSEEVLKSYKEKLSDFTTIELDKELCFEAHKNDNFDVQTSTFSYKGEDPEKVSQLERYLNHYKMEE